MVTLYATWPLGSRLAQIFPRMLRSLTTRTGLSLFCAAAPFRPPLFFFAMVEAFREWSDRGTGLRNSNCVGFTETCIRVSFPGDQPTARRGGGRRHRERVEPFDTSGALDTGRWVNAPGREQRGCVCPDWNVR